MKIVAMVVMAALLLMPLNVAAQEEIKVPETVSLAVARTVQRHHAGIYNKVTANEHLTATDFATMAAGLEAHFADLEEAGVTENLQQWILTHESKFIETVPREELLMLWNRAKATGQWSKNANFQDYVNYMDRLSLTHRRFFLTYVREHGLHEVHRQVVAHLYRYSLLARNDSGFLTVAMPPCDIPWMGIISFYLGIVAIPISGGLSLALTYASVGLGAASWISGC